MQAKKLFNVLVAAGLMAFERGASAAEKTAFNFSFGTNPAAPDAIQISTTNLYRTTPGYGFEPGAKVSLTENSCVSDQPFYFSIALPEGNYLVTARLGGAAGGSTNTVKSELRRLMLEKIVAAPGNFEVRTFAVNVRTPRIAGGDRVHLKERERTNEMWNWDEKLTLEFNGTQPSVAALKIERADALPTVYLLGDSTVCDQPTEPWNSWGQMLPRFFKPEVVVANHAESGETLRSSLGAKRLDKILSTMKPGDYLFLQFGHNDMKDRATNALAVYKLNLKKFVFSAREKGGIPVLVTSMERKNGVDHDTLDGYPATVREVANEEGVALIDLHALSKTFYNALGRQIDKAFQFQDGTHHNNYGSYELAKCIVEGIKQNKLGLTKSIRDDFTGFDPAHPDSVETFEMPASPGAIGARPLGD